MSDMEMDDEEGTGTHDTTYDIISVLYHALQGAETYLMYADDAEDAGDEEAAQFFNEVMEEEERRAARAKKLLARRLREEEEEA